MINAGDAFERSEMGASMLRKQSLDAIGAHQLFDARKILHMSEGLNEETKIQFKKLQQSGPLRLIRSVPNDFAERCLALEARFPNFSDFINEILLPALALSHLRKTGGSATVYIFLTPKNFLIFSVFSACSPRKQKFGTQMLALTVLF